MVKYSLQPWMSYAMNRILDFPSRFNCLNFWFSCIQFESVQFILAILSAQLLKRRLVYHNYQLPLKGLALEGTWNRLIQCAPKTLEKLRVLSSYIAHAYFEIYKQRKLEEGSSKWLLRFLIRFFLDFICELKPPLNKPTVFWQLQKMHFIKMLATAIAESHFTD